MLSWLVILICSVFFALSLKRVFSGVFSTLHLVLIVFYAMQVVPLFVENIWGYDDLMYYITNMYYASKDWNVHVIYCFFVCISTVLFWFGGELLTQKREYVSLNEDSYYQANAYLFFALLLGIFSPFLSLIPAPDPSIYLTFARFYKLNFNSLDIPFVYHMVVVKNVVYVSFLSTIILYFFNDDRNALYNFFVFVGVVILTWFEGKRAFLVFALLAIIAIDIIRNRYVDRRAKFIVKSVIFGIVSVLFFLIYKQYTGKDVEMDFLSQYNQYYSRMACVKTAIYSVINNQSVLEYPGQSFLYDIFFFVPRGFWPEKPAMFVKYFTAYAINRKNIDFLSWNLITNMWCEYISNIGIFGYMLAMTLITFVAKITDLAESIFVRMWGMLFILLYLMFGFEYLVLIVYILFVVTLVTQKIKEKF